MQFSQLLRGVAATSETAFRGLRGYGAKDLMWVTAAASKD
jgi:hypothetical protein